jgi:protein-S-isoprenylcysteine O-methyltransferase Ste14
MNWSLLRAIIILPGTTLVFIPTILLLISYNSKYAPRLASPAEIWFWLALFVGGFGVVLSSWSMALFTQTGGGTPAPWDPPKKLVIRGPYRHIRNPMITGVVLMLSAEAMLFHSWPIAAWTVIFFVGNLIYFPLSEERGLEARFGDEYRVYRAQVPRWFPRLRPWKQEGDDH